MADIRGKVNTLYSLEQLAAGDTAVHRAVKPLPKLIVTMVYLVCVMSLDRYALARLAPYLFYPVTVMALAEVPFGMLLRRSLVALPFCLFAGVSNLLLDGTVISLFVLLARALLCTGAALLLVAVTPFAKLTGTLRRLRVPELLVTLLEMVYRYIGVLVGEATEMLTAFRLRSGGVRWPRVREFGPFVGQLLLRSTDRAERVYRAMQCRGYPARKRAQTKTRGPAWGGGDWCFLLLGAGSSVLFRLIDVTALLGGGLQ